MHNRKTKQEEQIMKSAGWVKDGINTKRTKPLGTNKHGALFYLKRDWQLYLLLLIPLVFALIFKYGSMAGLWIELHTRPAA